MADGSGPIVVPASAHPREGGGPLDVVYFAGCGGSSEGYRMALGTHPAVALNHNAVAIGVHQANFPDTEHFIADVFDVDPRCIRPGMKWRSFWASPDCRHFSKAKGGAPVSPRVRGLAWVVVKVAKLLGPLAPDVIFLENVEEFRDWAPLIAGGDGKLRPDPARKGETFRLWVRRLEQCGYVVEHRELIAADYGAPTTRKRLFVVARRDGLPIVWPDPTHAPRKSAAARGLAPYVAAAEIIDWTIPCPSIFLTREEVKALGLRCKRPLEEATLRRIAKGVQRYVIGAAEPFVVSLTHHGGDRVRDLGEPLNTVTGAHRGEMALVAPSLIRTDNHSEGHLRGLGSVEDPLRTVTSAGGLAVAAAFLTKFSENSTGHLPDEPLHTVMAGAPRHGLVAAYLGRQFGTGVGRDLNEAHPTVMTEGGGGKSQLVAAHLTKFRPESAGADLREPLPTVTANSFIKRPGCGVPLGVVTADLAQPFGDHGEELRAFLVKYYGTANDADLAEPLHSVTSRARFGLVVVAGQVLQITDIGMRMLTPTELKAAQGFPRGYVTGWSAHGGAVTKTQETLLIGNSVSPINGAALIAANLLEPEAERTAA